MASAPAYFADSLESAVSKFIDENSAALIDLSTKIWNNPELSYAEFQAVENICSFLTQRGYAVTRNYKDVETAFLAEFQTPNYDAKRNACVAVLCEYDALPEIGHACGHNLISEAGVAAFLATCDALTSSGKEGKVVCVGTPAEEGGGGKVLLVQKGGFEGFDFALMAHPAPINVLVPPILGCEDWSVEFTGKAAHAAVGPWMGVNALDAAVSAYNGISVMRQQLKPGNLVHVIIENGGSRTNVIPEYSKVCFGFRAPTIAEANILRKRIVACFEAAALATGCEMKLKQDRFPYSGLLSNMTMLDAYEHFAKMQGMTFPVLPGGSYGSTDFGNVSAVVPGIHPGFYVGGFVMIHTKEFQVLAGTDEAHRWTQKTAVVMALTALELLLNKEFRTRATQEFAEKQPDFIGANGANEGKLEAK